MLPRFMSAKRILLALVATLVLAVAAGCGSDDSSDKGSSSSSSSSTSKKDSAIAAQVPAAIKDKGTLVVAVDATYPPNEFIKEGTHDIIGMTPDLANALGQIMGLKIEMKPAGFDAIIPGLAAKKYDLGFSSFTDNKEREQTVDFVTYFSAGTSFYVTTKSGADINSLEDLCGHKVAVEKGTTQQDDSQAQAKKCKAAGKPAADVQTYPDQNGANLALSSGRAEVGMADSPVAAYIVKKSGGQFKLDGEPYGTAPYGIAIPKGNGMAKPLLAAVKKIMADGTYMKVLKKWGIAQGAIDDPVINGAID
jgi:polar amino acid transport system substrate-binding protein